MRRSPATATAVGLMAALVLAAPAAARTRASVGPLPAHPGSVLTVLGSGWHAGEVVTILVGPPRSEAAPVRRVRAGAQGGLRARVPIAASATPGSYVLLVCQRACRLKVTLPVRITRP